MNKKADLILQYLRSEYPGFDAADVTTRGDLDYLFCVQRPGEILWLRIQRPFLDVSSAEAIALEIRRSDLAAQLRRLGAAIVTTTGAVQSLAK